MTESIEDVNDLAKVLQQKAEAEVFITEVKYQITNFLFEHKMFEFLSVNWSRLHKNFKK